MATRRWTWLLAVVGVITVSLPVGVSAQSLSLGHAMGHLEDQKQESTFTMFTYMLAGYSPMKMVYSGNVNTGRWDNINNQLQTDTSDFTYNERKQKMLMLGPQFGVRFSLPAGFSFGASLGVSYLKLKEDMDTPVPNSWYGNDHQDFYNYDPNPGFSASLSVAWEAVRFRRISAVLGLQLQYLSTLGLSGHSVTGNENYADGSGRYYSEASTSDLSMHLFIMNSFGMSFTFMFSAGTLNRHTNFSHITIDNAGNQVVDPGYSLEETNIDVSVHPIQYLGAYYAWYFAIPHFGTLGAEIQFGSLLVGMVSYQYMF